MKRKVLPRFPNLDNENELKSQGYELIAGIDEVGRGALAGPVVASAVILPHPATFSWLGLVRDSKQLDSRKRETLFELISQEVVAVGIGIVPSQVIDAINILKATKLAMMQAVEKLPQQPSFLIIDRVTLPQCPIPQRGITRGDKSCLSIACASIVAKVTRDRIMEEFDQIYPGYGFGRHKGYGTRKHIVCLQKLGPSPIHRLYFAPVRNLIANQSSGSLAFGYSQPFTSYHFESFLSYHSQPFPSHHSEPLPASHSESFSFCHSEGAERPKNLIQGKPHEGAGDGPPRSG
jgi:ribonuclease HII